MFFTGVSILAVRMGTLITDGVGNGGFNPASCFSSTLSRPAQRPPTLRQGGNLCGYRTGDVQAIANGRGLHGRPLGRSGQGASWNNQRPPTLSKPSARVLYPKAIEATTYGISGCPTTYHTLSGKIFSELGNIPRLAEFHILLEQNPKQRGIGA